MGFQNKLVRKKKFDSPVVEQTPVIWRGSLFVVESWHDCWEDPASKACHVRVRREEDNSIVARTMHGFSYTSAFVWEDTAYVFGSGTTKEVPDTQAIYMSSSSNMADWTEPELIVLPEEGEMLFNQSVCHGGNGFIMAYETDACVKFTLKFARSSDLRNWRKMDGAIYGEDRYAACPAIRHVDGYYYMVYLEHLLPEWKFATYMTRSRNLVDWEDAPHNPVLSPNPRNPVHADCPVHGSSDDSNPHVFTQDDLDLSEEEQRDLCPSQGMECNASDMDFVEWNGKTKVYFTGGCQHWGGDLQMAEFDGSLKEFLESYFEE